jgi:hypothetical protein
MSRGHITPAGRDLRLQACDRGQFAAGYIAQFGQVSAASGTGVAQRIARGATRLACAAGVSRGGAVVWLGRTLGRQSTAMRDSYQYQ